VEEVPGQDDTNTKGLVVVVVEVAVMMNRTSSFLGNTHRVWEEVEEEVVLEEHSGRSWKEDRLDVDVDEEVEDENDDRDVVVVDIDSDNCPKHHIARMAVVF